MKESVEQSLKTLVDGFGSWVARDAGPEAARMTSALHPYTHLFSPVRVNGVVIKNRLVMAPMANIQMADELGRPSAKMISYFQDRARGGAGLLTSGLVPVGQREDPTLTEPGGRTYFPRLDTRTTFAGWRDLARAVHAFGATFFVQLTPGMGRVGSPECLLTKHALPVSASWNPNFYIPRLPCRPLSDRQCRRIIRAAGQAAANAQAMAIDGVYLHGHEGYLLEQMANPAFNRRRLGRFADWGAFGVEMVKEIRGRVGGAYPIMYRIDMSLALNATYGEKMSTARSLRKFRNERTVPQTLDYMERLVAAGVDLFDVDLGCYDNWWLPHPPNSMPAGCFLEIARIARQHFVSRRILSNAGLPVPIVAVGKLGYPDIAEQALRDGSCDMIMLGRPLLADPEWPNKAFAGKVDQIRPCIGDQEACLNELTEGGHLQCAVNPRTGFEDILGAEPSPAARRRKVAVVGAGPAGIACASAASRRGHDVTLYEQADRIGGMLVAGRVPRIKFDVANYVRFLEHSVEDLTRDHGLKVRLSTRASADGLAGERHDVIVVATGALPCVPTIPGADLPHVVQAVDLLRSPSVASSAARVLVVGGGIVGCEVAHFLAWERGKTVTIVEMLPVLMKGICTATRGYLVHHLDRKGVALLNCARVKSIQETSVTIVRNMSRTVPDPRTAWEPVLPDNIKNPFAVRIRNEEQEVQLPADLVVFAVGLKPNNALYETCLAEHAAPEVRHIGDSFAVGRVFEAVKSGDAVGRSL